MDELVKDLRESAPKALAEADFDFVEGWLKEAADAIESLQKTVLRLEDESGILDELPMVDQREPPKAEEAEWTEENTCSHCGDEACAGYDEEPWRTRYCPHCGAKMKNPEEYE